MTSGNASMLAHVYWIGGSPCSGKSTIAGILAERHNLLVYQCDSHFDAHQQRAAAEHQPELYKLRDMSWDAIWMRPVAELIADEIAIYREEFAMVLADLHALPADRPILVEGAGLLPELVAPLLADSRRAIWIVPSPKFQLALYSQREWINGILGACSEPDQAFRNWMARDIGFAEAVARDAAARGCRVITVDGTATIEENAQFVAGHFGLS